MLSSSFSAFLIVILGELLFSAFISFFAIRELSYVSHIRKLFDEVDERTVHEGAIPRLAGLAFMPITVFIVSLFSWLCDTFLQQFGLNIMFSREVLLLISGSILLYVVGVVDDLNALSYRKKFATQIIAIILLLFSDVFIRHFEGIFFLYEIPTLAGIFLSFFFLLWVINAFNLIDGIDGLAGGLALISLLVYGLFSLLNGLFFYALLCSAVIGILLGYLRLNIWGSVERKNKIFMGDTGSLTLGLLIGFLSLRMWNFAGAPPWGQTAIAVAVSPLLIPCLDLLYVMLVRISNNKHPFKPDKTHIHHRLMSLGYSQRRVLTMLLSASAIMVIFNLIASFYVNIGIVALADIIIWLVANAVIHRKKHG